MPSAELLQIVGPALAAGLMIALTHAPLGIAVLQRGIIFIDLAVAQVAGLGLVMAATLLPHHPWWAGQACALAAALLAGLFFRWAERRLPGELEAIIGCSFVLAASAALLLLADAPHGGDEIRHMLSGQILFVGWQDVLLHAPIYAAILFLWLRRRWEGLAFYAIFAVAITSSVQLAGVYVVFASLVMPALASVHARHRLATAWAASVLSLALGMAGALILDWPAGPSIVLAYGATCLAFRKVSAVT